MKILNFGSLNIDKTYGVDHIVEPGETINSFSHEDFIGGKGLNQSIALARAGAQVWHAGLVGQQDGSVLVDALELAGVKTSLIETRPGVSGHALIQVDKAGMNSIIVSPGTNRMVDEVYIDRVLDNFSQGDLLLIQNEISGLPYLVDRAYERGMVIAFNPSPMDDLVMEVDFGKISYFIVNELEAGSISGRETEAEVLEDLIRRFPSSSIVMTLGKDGALYRDADKEYRVAGRQVDSIDTTGAGDTFTGYFLALRAEGRSIEQSMDMANQAAALSCTVRGASNSIPLIKDLAGGE